MISYAYSQRNQYNSTPIQTVLCCIVFIDLTAFFVLTFMNICFDTIVDHPSIVMMVILYSIMGLDIVAQFYYRRQISFTILLHIAIMIILILSWTVSNQQVIFLSALIFLRFPQIIKFNTMIQDKVRSSKILFKIYTFCKIVYLFILLGHVLGCIFYAIDNTLIKSQHYGPIQQNPFMYYQGNLLCYSPIYSLSEINHYIYAMYYIFSLLATVAYGDIIPKNPYENAYVCVLLVLSTVSMSFIIEQLLIVLNDNWQMIYQILRKVKYLDSMLQKSQTISLKNRLKLVSFILYSLRHQATNYPDFTRLTTHLHSRLIGQSIGMRQLSYNTATQQGRDKISNDRIHHDYSLPRFLAEYLLLKLEIVYFPGNLTIVNNQNLYDPSAVFINIKGKFVMGYGDKLHMKKALNDKFPNKLHCWRQFIWNNKSLHPYFYIQTKDLCQFYTISTQTLMQIIKQQRIQSLTGEYFSKMLQVYHITKNRELTQIYDDKLSNQLNSPSTNAQNTTTSMNSAPTIQSLSTNKIPQVKVDTDHKVDGQISSHILKCWSCGSRTHFPVYCPYLHYIPTMKQIFKRCSKKKNLRAVICRKNLKSKKIGRVEEAFSTYTLLRSHSSGIFSQRRSNIQQSPKKSQSHSNISNFNSNISLITSRIHEHKTTSHQSRQMPSSVAAQHTLIFYIHRKQQQLQNLKNQFYGQMPFITERYQHYENFYHEFNLQEVQGMYVYGGREGDSVGRIYGQKQRQSENGTQDQKKRFLCYDEGNLDGKKQILQVSQIL